MTISTHLYSRFCLRLTKLLSVVCASFFVAVDTVAQDTWTGATNGDWSVGTNWLDGSAPVPASAGILTFTGTSNTTTNNDLTGVVGTFAFTNTTAGQSFTIGGNQMTLSANVSTTASSGLGITDTINLNFSLGSATRTFNLGTLHNLDTNGIISGAVAGAGITKAQAGTLGLLGTANTFTGALTITQGNVNFNTIANSTQSSSLGAGTTITIAGTTTTGQLTNVGAGGTTNRQVQIGSGNTGNARASIFNNGSGALVFTATSFNVQNGSAPLNTSRTLELGGSNTGANEIQGIIRNNVVGGTNATSSRVAIFKTGAGSWTLSGLNEHTNNTSIDAGTLSINTLLNAGIAQSLGRTTSVTIGGTSDGTLRYTGGATSSTINPVIGAGSGTGNATFLNDGTGAVTWNNATSFNFASGAAVGPRSITLGGSYTGGVNQITSPIIDNTLAGATVSVIKSGPGSWAFTGLNTYTGTTSVNGGSLQVGAAGVGRTGTGNVTVSNLGTLLGTGIVRGSTFTAESGSNIHAGDSTVMGTFGTLTFTPASGSGSFDFQSGSNTVLDLDFANPSGSDQLFFDGLSSGTLNFNGNLTVGPASFTPTGTALFQLLDWINLSSVNFASQFSGSGLLLGNGDEAPGLNLPDISSGGIYFWDISDFSTNGSISIVLVPEPSRVLLLGLGSVLLMLRRRRK
jgi:autotransporter-associated beta strand protein